MESPIDCGVVIEGTLKKQSKSKVGKLRKKYNHRHFVLKKNGKLEYTKPKSDSHEGKEGSSSKTKIKTIDIKNCARRLHKDPLNLTIVDEKGHHNKLKFCSEEEKKQWM